MVTLSNYSNSKRASENSLEERASSSNSFKHLLSDNNEEGKSYLKVRKTQKGVKLCWFFSFIKHSYHILNTRSINWYKVKYFVEDKTSLEVDSEKRHGKFYPGSFHKTRVVQCPCTSKDFTLITTDYKCSST